MLEKPSIPDEKIIACLQTDFGLKIERLIYMPLGADLNTAVYRAVSRDDRRIFVKLRSGLFNELSTIVPAFLHEEGLAQVIAPVETTTGALWTSLDEYKVILYPYVDGHDGYDAALTDQQWVELGRTIRRIHEMDLPVAIQARIERENWSGEFRKALREIMEEGRQPFSTDPLILELIAFLKERRELILDLLERTERLAAILQEGARDYCLCHGDLHAGNLLIHAKGDVYLVDWDDLVLAPKEKDLMSVGGGLFGGWRVPAEEEALFYRGYGERKSDPNAMAYYRYERIITDLAVECTQIFQMEGTGEDREQALKYLRSNFLPDGCIAIAYEAAGDRAE
jgi:spectinomycin phosphotransferase